MRCRLHPRPLPALLASLALDAERVVTGDSLRARVGWRNAVGGRVAARQPVFLGTHFVGRQDAGLSRALPRCPVRLRIGVVHVVVGVQGLSCTVIDVGIVVIDGTGPNWHAIQASDTSLPWRVT
jgi:hypothetical protein